MFLEQLILKHNMQKQCLDVQEEEVGLNFLFAKRELAASFSQFVQDHISCRMKSSKQLISHDEKNGTAHHKHTFLIDLAPVCKDDLVLLPKPLSKDLGGIGPLVLVYKISKFIHIVDVQTM